MFEEKAIKIFSSRDKIREEIIGYAEKYLDIQDLDLSKTDYMSYLINVLSILTSNLIYYNSSVYREFFLTKAQQKESVINLATMLGYNPETAVPATAQVIIQMDANFKRSTNIILYGRTEPQDPSGDYRPAFKFYAKDVEFALQNTVEIQVIADNNKLLNMVARERLSNGSIVNIPWRMSSDKSKVYFSLNVVQAKDQYIEFTIPKLNPGEFFDKFVKFDGDLVDIQLFTKENNSVTTVSTAGTSNSVNPYTTGWVEWDYKENKNSIYLINSGEYKYSFRLVEGGLKIFFGNGVIGTPPPMGHTCRIKISTTNGSYGNVIAGSINSGENMVGYDLYYSGNQTPASSKVRYSVINRSPASGGIDYPSMDEIRRSAMVQVTANNRLVSQSDFENIKTIIPELPIDHAIPILKRSDIKQNNITLFTDLIYQDSIVPTRNEEIYVPVDSTNIFDATTSLYGTYSLYVPSGAPVFIDDDGETYNNMFDLYIDTSRNIAVYGYLINDVKKELTISSIERYGAQDRTIINPQNVNFRIVEVPNEGGVLETLLEINFYFNFIVKIKSISDSLTAYVQIGDSGEYRDMTRFEYEYDITKIEDFYNENHGFTVQIPIQYIPEGDVNFYFYVNGGIKILESGPNSERPQLNKLYYVAAVPNGETGYFSYDLGTTFQPTQEEINGFTSTGYTLVELTTILKSSSETVVRQDMSDFMYSPVFVDSSAEGYYIFDVPVIQREYWNKIYSEELVDDFITQVYSKIVTFDITQYKMMTDFVNLKFSNTRGKLDNMNFNANTINYVDFMNPNAADMTSIMESGSIVNVIVTNVADNPFMELEDLTSKEETIISDLPFLAVWFGTYTSPSWKFRPLVTNDIFQLRSEMEDTIKYIFNGTNVYSVNKQIPLELLVHLWIDKTYPESEASIVNRVKNNIIEKILPKLGYDKSIYRSQIVKIIQETPGVDYCVLLRPEHDIFFNYNIYKDFTQEQILRYSPQLVQIVKESINVVVRNNK